METVCSSIIDNIVEWIGLKHTKSQIKAKLREANKNIDIKTIEGLISLARKKIRQLYKIDPLEFKGSAIEFYCSVIRGEHDVRYKILCQERLDKLLGIDQIASEDPNTYADKVLQAMRQADGSVTGNVEDEKAVEENYTDIFCEVRISELPEHLKNLAENLSADK